MLRRGGRPGFVYVFDAVDDPHVKVGKSVEPPGRRSTVQTGNPYQVEVYSTYRCRSIEVAGEVERYAHRLLDECRGPAGNEWFEVSAQDADRAVSEGYRRATGRWVFRLPVGPILRRVRVRLRRFGVWVVRGLAVVGAVYTGLTLSNVLSRVVG